MAPKSDGARWNRAPEGGTRMHRVTCRARRTALVVAGMVVLGSSSLTGDASAKGIPADAGFAPVSTADANTLAAAEALSQKTAASNAMAPPSTFAVQSCPFEYSCTFFYAGREGWQKNFHGSLDSYGWLYFTDGYSFRSAKNDFGNRRFQVRTGSGGEVKCLNPGAFEDNYAVAKTQVNIGQSGSRC